MASGEDTGFGAPRPRGFDCDPSTDSNLCASEREYSIETARCSRASCLLLLPCLDRRSRRDRKTAGEAEVLDWGATSYSGHRERQDRRIVNADLGMMNAEIGAS